MPHTIKDGRWMNELLAPLTRASDSSDPDKNESTPLIDGIGTHEHVPSAPTSDRNPPNTMYNMFFLLLVLFLQPTPTSTEAINDFKNIKIYREHKTLTVKVTWDLIDTTTNHSVKVTYATTPSFIKGTQLGQMTTHKNQVRIALPSVEYSPINTVIYVRLQIPPSEDFIESVAWMSTSKCGDGSHYLNDTTWNGELEPDVSLWTCNLCPKHALCPGGRLNTWNNVQAYFGSWRENQQHRGASNFTECLAPNMCLGAPNEQLKGLYGIDPTYGIDVALISNYTEGCYRGGTGPLCSVCVNGTWRTNSFDCTKCSDPGLSVFFVGLTIFVIVVILVATIIVTIVDEETETAIDLQMVKIMVNHLVISSSTSKLPLKWSPLLQSVFNAFDVLSFSFGTGAMSLECVQTSFAWRDTLIAVALTPVVLVLLPVITLWPCRKTWATRCRLDAGTTIQVSAMIGLLLAHPSITKITLHLFACRTINEKRYLEIDFSVPCDNNDYLNVLRYALGIPMILLYCVGIPVWYFVRLWRHRDDLDAVIGKYGFLLSGFKPTRFYWELYNTVRKGLFTATTVIFLPLGARLQIWATMAVLQGFLAMETWGHPHVNPVLNAMEDLALSLDVFQLFLGLGLFFVTDVGSNNLAEVFSVLILASNVFFIFHWLRIWYKHSDYRKIVAVAVVKGIKTMSLKTVESVVRSTKGMSLNIIRRKNKDGSVSMTAIDINDEYYAKAQQLLGLDATDAKAIKNYAKKHEEEEGSDRGGDDDEEDSNYPTRSTGQAKTKKTRRKSCRIPRPVALKGKGEEKEEEEEEDDDDDEEEEDVFTYEIENVLANAAAAAALSDTTAATSSASEHSLWSNKIRMGIKRLTREEIKDRKRKIQLTNKMMGAKASSPRPTTRAAALGLGSTEHSHSHSHWTKSVKSGIRQLAQEERDSIMRYM